MILKLGQNNLFRGVNRPISGIKRDIWVPLKKKRIKIEWDGEDGQRGVRCERFFFSLLVSLSDLRKSNRRNSSGKERKVLYATRATRGYQKHGISPRIQVKIRKIQIFSFS